MRHCGGTRASHPHFLFLTAIHALSLLQRCHFEKLLGLAGSPGLGSPIHTLTTVFTPPPLQRCHFEKLLGLAPRDSASAVLFSQCSEAMMLGFSLAPSDEVTGREGGTGGGTTIGALGRGALLTAVL